MHTYVLKVFDVSTYFSGQFVHSQCLKGEHRHTSNHDATKYISLTSHSYVYIYCIVEHKVSIRVIYEHDECMQKSAE